MKKKFLLILLLTFIPSSIFSMKINRVILSSNSNPFYLDFWPIVAKAWKRLGVKPTLALICDGKIEIDESLGDIIKINPLPDIPIAFQATTIRLLLPAYFEDDICILSDIDMLPLNKDFLLGSVAKVSDDKFVIYRDKYYHYKNITRYPMCYTAAKGKTFKEVFQIQDTKQIPQITKYWYKLSLHAAEKVAASIKDKKKAEVEKRFTLAWSDERIMVSFLNAWKDSNTRLVKLGFGYEKFINRYYWGYDSKLLKEGFYYDAHLPRPYFDSKNKKIIDKLLKDANLEDLILPEKKSRDKNA